MNKSLTVQREGVLDRLKGLNLSNRRARKLVGDSEYAKAYFDGKDDQLEEVALSLGVMNESNIKDLDSGKNE